MNRRGFLGAIAAAVAGAALDPERLLWKPGARLISIPRPRLAAPSEVVTVREFHNLRTGDVVTFYGDWKTYVIREQRAYNAYLSLQAEQINLAPPVFTRRRYEPALGESQ